MSLGIIDSNYLGQTFDKRRILGLVDDGAGPELSAIDIAISAAENEVYNTLSRQYTLEALSADASIKRAVAVTTMHMLELRRSDLSQAVTAAYSQTLSYLQRLVDGEAKLGGVAEVLPRITHTNAADVFEHSAYFSGLPDLENT